MNSEEKDLEEIIAGFLSGNSVHFRTILTKVTQFVYHQMSGTSAEKDDVISEVLEILLNSFRNKAFRGDSIKALNVYIYTIVRFRVNRVLRHRSRMHYTDTLPEVVDESRSTLSETADRELVRKLLDAIDPKCRNLLQFKFLLGWSDQEIADKIRKSKNATSTAITRCLQKAQKFPFLIESQ